MIPAVYHELLAEFCHIKIPPSSTAVDQQPTTNQHSVHKQFYPGQHILQNIVYDNPDCCSDPEITHGPRGENAYCMTCGLCLKNRFLQLDFVRVKTGVFFTKKRFYAPVTHFKEHLRRYMGARFTKISDQVIENTKNVDVTDRDAYFRMKDKLKQMKMSKLYKEIFTLIYIHGGVKAGISNDVYEKCVQDFKVLMQKFLGTRTDYQRHSMPCNYMLLDILLRKNGHEPYYRLPYLKNEKCRQRVMEIYSDLKSKALEI